MSKRPHTITKHKNRVVQFWPESNTELTITEKTAYGSSPGSRRNWEHTVVCITIEELKQICELAGFEVKEKPPAPQPIPRCEECDMEMGRYTDPNTGKGGWGCDLCGWSEDDQ